MAAALPLTLVDSGGFYTFYTHFLTSTSLRGHSEVFLISTLRPLEKNATTKERTKETYSLP